MDGAWEELWEGIENRLAVPDLWQQDAIRALRDGRDVVLSAPTGAGKTFVFESLVSDGRALRPGRQSVYTVPTRALANDKWREWRAKGWDVGIATGDLSENVEAPVLVATLETQRERFLSGKGPGLLVVDEYQMIGDRNRGLQYELAIALAPAGTQLLLMSGSVGNPGHIRDWLARLQRDAALVETRERPVPLDEIFLDALPRSAPRSCRNFWQRLALSTLLSRYGPLLVFAPHRRAAEKIARKIAEALPEDDPIHLGGGEAERACSKDLARLLRKRVAYHHSGLGFTERAAVVEPLAKSGQLRVIVATMGLAAGINFSVRSVFVSESTYQDGPFRRDVSPDELLQMFGRAGRRGLDESGFVIVGDRTPRLGDAHPLELRRQNELDWPTLIRRMHLADERAESPVDAARELRDRLFSKQRIELGFGSPVGEPEESGEREKGDPRSSESASPLFGLKPTRKEVLTAKGRWEPVRPGRDRRSRLGDSLSYIRGRYREAEGNGALVTSLLPERARLCRLDGSEPHDSSESPPRKPRSSSRRYGLEMIVATERESGRFRLTRFARSWSGETPSRRRGRRRKRGAPREDEVTYSYDEAAALLPEVFADRIAPARFERLVRRDDRLVLQAHFCEAEIDTYLDSDGVPLHAPKQRHTEIESETHVTAHESGESFQARSGTAVHAWRKLRLVDEHGVPTPRGILFSLFQGGEGLAVAAALDDPHYEAGEIIRHLANLRAGYRFELDTVPEADRIVDSVGSERLAAACRQAHGPVDHPGYLQLGLPPHYGEGAAEVIDLMLRGQLHRLLAAGGASLEFGPGDVERAYVEWLSLLRHIRHAPDLADERWMELKEAAARELDRRDRRSPLARLPDLPASALQKPPQRGLPFHALSSSR